MHAIIRAVGSEEKNIEIFPGVEDNPQSEECRWFVPEVKMCTTSLFGGTEDVFNRPASFFFESKYMAVKLVPGMQPCTCTCTTQFNHVYQTDKATVPFIVTHLARWWLAWRGHTCKQKISRLTVASLWIYIYIHKLSFADQQMVKIMLCSRVKGHMLVPSINLIIMLLVDQSTADLNYSQGYLYQHA